MRTKRVFSCISWMVAQAADQLVDQRPQHAFVGYARLDTFGDEAALVDYVALEVAILAVAALLHSSNRAHRPVVLEALSMRDHQFTRALVDARQQATQHDGVGASSDSLGDISGVLNASISDDRHIILAGNAGAVIDGGYLRHADARDDTCGAY